MNARRLIESIEEYKLNILIFAGSFYPFFGGYENFIYNLSKKLIQKGHYVDILTTNTENCGEFEDLDGIKIYRVPCWNALNRTFPIPIPTFKFFHVFYLIYKKDYDIINTHTRFFITTFLGAVFAKLKKVPHIHIEHGSTHSVLVNKFVSWINVIYDHSIGWLIIKSATINVGISKLSCDFLRHIGDNNPILILDGIDTEVFKKLNTNLRNELNLNSNFIIVFIGRLVYAKGVQDLISIFPKIKAKRHDVKILVVGDGPYKRELEKMIQDQYKEDIIFLGTKTQQEVVKFLNIADIFVNLSYSEGFGITVLEAGAVGVPIIATNVGGVPELIKNYENGISIEPENRGLLYKSIIDLLDNPTLRERLGNNIITEIRRNYSWNMVATKYERLFQGVAHENRLFYHSLSIQK